MSSVLSMEARASRPFFLLVMKPRLFCSPLKIGVNGLSSLRGAIELELELELDLVELGRSTLSSLVDSSVLAWASIVI